MSGSPCPSELELKSYLTGALAPMRHEHLTFHIDACPDCQRRLQDLEMHGAAPVVRLEALLNVDQYDSEPECQSALMRAEAIVPGAADGSALLPAADRPALPEVALGRFGAYELLEVIGRGGMGLVYKARDTRLNRVVALKMIGAGHLAAEQERERFRVEAEATASLDHPNIVPIYEVGKENGQHFFAMALIEGRSLATRVVTRPLPAREAAEVVRLVAGAVAYAHTQGVIHRDLKPGNVLIDAAGQPRVTDFGLAKRVDSDSDLTRTGQIMGTPSYMPPEQAEGNSALVGPLSDVYSLGATLYCLLTGRAPFHAATTFETLKQVQEREPVPPRQLNHAIDRDINTICLKCLEKRQDRRYASAQDLADDLGRFLNGQPILARPIGATERAVRWMRRRPAVASLLGALVVAVAAGTVGVYVKYRDAEFAAAHAKQQQGIAERKTIETKEEADAKDRALREARWLLANSLVLVAQTAYQGNDLPGAMVQLGRVPADEDQLRRWEWDYLKNQFEGGIFSLHGHGGRVTSVAFSPKGTHLATAAIDGRIRLWDSRTGRLLLAFTAHNDMVWRVAFSPDGTRLATASEEQTVRIWDAQSGALVRELKGHTAQVRAVAFSPDGQRVATASLDRTVQVWDAQSGAPLLTVKGHTDMVWDVAFSPDGASLATCGSDRTARLWAAATGKPLHVLNGHTEQVSAVAFSPDGTRLATSAEDFRAV